MTRWLRNNPIGLGLAALCGVLLSVMAVLGIVSTLPVDRNIGDAGTAAGDEALTLPQLGESPPLDAFRVITERPLFNESRQPLLASDLDADAMAENVQDDEVELPEVELSGVVITPSLRMATLRRKDEGPSLVAFEGRPIEGPFGSWQVSRIDERQVVLTSGAGEELELKLRVHDEKIAPPKRPERKEEAAEKGSEASSEQPAEGERLSRAEEIRQRIAERREELRRQAEEQQAAEEQAQPSYQSAIRSLIGRNRRNEGSQDNEK